MIEEMIDTVRAITEATISGKLEWKYVGRWPEDDPDGKSLEEIESSLVFGSTFKATWGNRILQIWKEGDIKKTVLLVGNENIGIKVRLSEELGVYELNKYLRMVYAEIYSRAEIEMEDTYEKVLILLNDITLSL